MKVLQTVVIIILSHHAVALSTHAQFSQRHGHALLNQNRSDHECPSVWSEYNQVTHDCQCIQHIGLLDCEGENVYASTRHILTYDSTEGIISAVRVRYIKYLEGYNLTVTKDGSTGILLPNNISELNSYMCGPLNREDYLCNKCKSGYGPPIIPESTPYANMCYLCKDTWIPKGILLYLAVSFIPLTLFYLLILIFQVRLTSAPMTCFIMYSQLMIIVFCTVSGPGQSLDSVISQIKFMDNGKNFRISTKILLTFYGVFNLDFFHYVMPPFCISNKLRPIHISFLGYISAFYPNTPYMVLH